MSELRPGDITDEMRQAMDLALRERFQRELRSLAARIRADATGRYAGAEPGWQAGVEWTLLWIENTASQLTEGRPKQAGGGLAARGPRRLHGLLSTSASWDEKTTVRRRSADWPWATTVPLSVDISLRPSESMAPTWLSTHPAIRQCLVCPRSRVKARRVGPPEGGTH